MDVVDQWDTAQMNISRWTPEPGFGNTPTPISFPATVGVGPGYPMQVVTTPSDGHVPVLYLTLEEVVALKDSPPLVKLAIAAHIATIGWYALQVHVGQMPTPYVWKQVDSVYGGFLRSMVKYLLRECCSGWLAAAQ